jgi:hypothetical protein
MTRFVLLAFAALILSTTASAQPSVPANAQRAWDAAERQLRENRQRYDEANKKVLANLARDLQRLNPPVDLVAITDEFRMNVIPATDKDAGVLPSPLPDPSSIVFGGHRYKLVREECTWTDAKKKCEEMGGHLAYIESRDEQKVISDWLKAYFELNKATLPDGPTVWIGAEEKGAEGKWQWLNGQPFGFTQWRGHHPHRVEADRNVLSMSMTGGEWINLWDRIHPGTLFFLCEFDR